MTFEEIQRSSNIQSIFGLLIIGITIVVISFMYAVVISDGIKRQYGPNEIDKYGIVTGYSRDDVRSEIHPYGFKQYTINLSTKDLMPLTCELRCNFKMDVTGYLEKNDLMKFKDLYRKRGFIKSKVNNEFIHPIQIAAEKFITDDYINKRDEIIKDFEAALVDSCRKEGITVTDVNIRNFRFKIADPIMQANSGSGSRSSSGGLPNQINPTRQMQNHAIKSTGLKTGSFF